MSSESKKNCSSLSAKELFIGSVIGGAVGALAALLLAPKTGEEFRKELHLKDTLDSSVGKVKQLSSSLLSKNAEPYS